MASDPSRPLPFRPTPDRVASFYDQADIACRFNASRSLSDEVLDQWVERIGRQIGPARRAVAVDLGCGTGRFTGVLARHFAEMVIGIDPSAPMLAAAAAQSAGGKGVHFVRAAAERLPLARSSADLVFLSMVYHHFADDGRALASIRRVLRPGGCFCVRTCTAENLYTYVYQRFIPEARAVDEARLPSRAGLTAAAERAGMRPTAFDTVHQAVARTLDEYVHNASLRAHSDLQAISDDQFDRGMAALRAWAETQDNARPIVEDVDLFTFTVD